MNKKRIIISIAFILVTLFAASGAKNVLKEATAPVSNTPIIVIDPGHGGKDAGTSGIDGTPEKEINLAIATALRDYLEVCGIHTAMTREGDNELYPEGSDRSRSDLYNRLDFVNAQPNPVLISVHQNHYTDESAVGTQIWYSGNHKKSKLYADLILNSVKEKLQPENTRVNKKSDNSYYILYKATAPSIMIECGFMSNRDENEKLKNKEYQEKFAFATVTGICGELSYGRKE